MGFHQWKFCCKEFKGFESHFHTRRNTASYELMKPVDVIVSYRRTQTDHQVIFLRECMRGRHDQCEPVCPNRFRLAHRCGHRNPRKMIQFMELRFAFQKFFDNRVLIYYRRKNTPVRLVNTQAFPKIFHTVIPKYTRMPDFPTGKNGPFQSGISKIQTKRTEHHFLSDQLKKALLFKPEG